MGGPRWGVRVMGDLVLRQQGDDLRAIPARIHAARDVYPIRGARGRIALPDELVVRKLLEQFEPLLSRSRRGQMDVSSLAHHVLRTSGATHGLVELRTTVAATYRDGTAHGSTQRFQDVVAKSRQGHDNLRRGRVVYATSRSRSRARKLRETEMLTQADVARIAGTAGREYTHRYHLL